MSTEAGRRVSHYSLVEKIGEGGMGVVYRALDTRLNRQVAIKILRPEFIVDADRQRGFLREARAAAAVSHPGIATIHEIDEADGMTFIVMELVEGRSLGSMIQGQPMPVPDALHVAIQVADAMSRAHEAGIVHRDLKPDNIIVGTDGRARVLDFGLARICEAGAVPGGTEPDPDEASTRDVDFGSRLMGTVSYMSPEQALGGDMDARSDVFSFGVTLYEMLAGRRPFAGGNVTATLAKILEAEPEPLSRVRPDLGGELVRVVERCLRKDPTERFEGATELARALRAVDIAAAPASRSIIAVFPFSFRGSPEFAYLSEGLVDLLSTKLDGAGELRSVDPHVILCCAGAQTGGVMDPDGAKATAGRFGAGMFVLGSVLELGGQLHVDASLYDGTAAPRVLSKAAVRGEAGRIFEMVDQLIAELLARRPGGPGARLTRIASMATDTFDALKAYLEGEAEMRAMRRVTAVEAYRRAVALDPRFALAWYRLSVAALWSGQSHIAHEAARNAVTHSSRLSERDRDQLAAFDASLRGANEEAERRYRIILGDHPDDVEAWYQLGELQMHGGPLLGHSIVGSRDAWERLIALDPKHVNGWAHLGLIAASLGDQERLEDSMRHVLELSPSGDSAVWIRAFKAFACEDVAARGVISEDLRRASDHDVVHTISALGAYASYAGAHELAGLLIEPVRSAEVRGLGHIMRAYFDLARGRGVAARRELDLARSLSGPAELLHRVHLSISPLGRGEPAGTEAQRDQLKRMAEAPAAPRSPRAAWIGSHDGLHAQLGLYLAGMIDTRSGRPGGAVAQAALLESLGAPPETGSLVDDLVISLRAATARAEGDAAGALARLETSRMQARFDLTIWSPFHSHAFDRFARADLLDLAGRHEEALSWFGSFLGNSVYDQVYVAPAHFRRGEICERLGRREEAADHFTRFARILAGCDADLRQGVDEAAARAARLRG